MTNTSSNTPVITINGTEIQPLEYENQRVITLSMMDKVHSRPSGTARKRFNDNKARLINLEDYFVRNSDEARSMGITAPNGLILLSESGYLLLVKSFTDDLAWQVQRQLVRAYFKTKPESSTLTPSEQHEISQAVKLKAGENHKAIPGIWGRVKNKFKVAKYSQIPRERFQEVLVYVSEMEIKVLLKAEEPEIQEQEAPSPLTPEEKAALIDDIYNQIGLLRCSADGLLSFYRDVNRFLNKMGNLVAILNAVEYKDRRIREMAEGR